MQNQEICRKIRILLYRAELNVELCQKVKQYIGDKHIYSAKESFLIITANNSFNEAVTILNTLLGRDKSEVNLLKLGIQMPELEKIRTRFEGKNFPEIRNKLISHKDKKIKNDHTGHVWRLVLPDHVKNLLEIVAQLNKLVYKYFEIKFDPNNPFVAPFKGLHEIIELLQKEENLVTRSI